MGYYRKKPVIIEAVQLRWDTWNEICEFADVGPIEQGNAQGVFVNEEGQISKDHNHTLGLAIPTLEGVMIAREYDWIIRGVQGELYPCKPDIFEQTYEEVI